MKCFMWSVTPAAISAVIVFISIAQIGGRKIKHSFAKPSRMLSSKTQVQLRVLPVAIKKLFPWNKNVLFQTDMLKSFISSPYVIVLFICYFQRPWNNAFKARHTLQKPYQNNNAHHLFCFFCVMFLCILKWIDIMPVFSFIHLWNNIWQQNFPNRPKSTNGFSATKQWEIEHGPTLIHFISIF